MTSLGTSLKEILSASHGLGRGAGGNGDKCVTKKNKIIKQAYYHTIGCENVVTVYEFNFTAQH